MKKLKQNCLQNITLGFLQGNCQCLKTVFNHKKFTIT